MARLNNYIIVSTQVFELSCYKKKPIKTLWKNIVRGAAEMTVKFQL